MAPLGRYVADAGVRRTGSCAAMPATASPCAPAPLLLAAFDGEAGPVRPDGSRQVAKTDRPASPAGGATRAGRDPADEQRADASRPASARAGPGTEQGSGRRRTEDGAAQLASRSARGAPSLDAAAAAAAPPRSFCAPGFGPGPFIAGRSPGRVRKHISARPQPTRPVHPLSPPGPSPRVVSRSGVQHGAALPPGPVPAVPRRPGGLAAARRPRGRAGRPRSPGTSPAAAAARRWRTAPCSLGRSPATVSRHCREAAGIPGAIAAWDDFLPSGAEPSNRKQGGAARHPVTAVSHTSHRRRIWPGPSERGMG